MILNIMIMDTNVLKFQVAYFKDNAAALILTDWIVGHNGCAKVDADKFTGGIDVDPRPGSILRTFRAI